MLQVQLGTNQVITVEKRILNEKQLSEKNIFNKEMKG